MSPHDPKQFRERDILYAQDLQSAEDEVVQGWKDHVVEEHPCDPAAGIQGLVAGSIQAPSSLREVRLGETEEDRSAILSFRVHSDPGSGPRDILTVERSGKAHLYGSLDVESIAIHPPPVESLATHKHPAAPGPALLRFDTGPAAVKDEKPKAYPWSIRRVRGPARLSVEIEHPGKVGNPAEFAFTVGGARDVAWRVPDVAKVDEVLAVSADGCWVLLLAEGSLFVVDVSGRTQVKLKCEDPSEISAKAVTGARGAAHIAVGFNDGTVWRWRVVEGTCATADPLKPEPKDTLNGAGKVMSLATSVPRSERRTSQRPETLVVWESWSWAVWADELPDIHQHSAAPPAMAGAQINLALRRGLAWWKDGSSFGAMVLRMQAPATTVPTAAFHEILEGAVFASGANVLAAVVEKIAPNKPKLNFYRQVETAAGWIPAVPLQHEELTKSLKRVFDCGGSAVATLPVDPTADPPQGVCFWSLDALAIPVLVHGPSIWNRFEVKSSVGMASETSYRLRLAGAANDGRAYRLDVPSREAVLRVGADKRVIVGEPVAEGLGRDDRPPRIEVRKGRISQSPMRLDESDPRFVAALLREVEQCRLRVAVDPLQKSTGNSWTYAAVLTNDGPSPLVGLRVFQSVVSRVAQKSQSNPHIPAIPRLQLPIGAVERLDPGNAFATELAFVNTEGAENGGSEHVLAVMAYGFAPLGSLIYGVATMSISSS